MDLPRGPCFKCYTCYNNNNFSIFVRICHLIKTKGCCILAFSILQLENNPIASYVGGSTLLLWKTHRWNLKVNNAVFHIQYRGSNEGSSNKCIPFVMNCTRTTFMCFLCTAPTFRSFRVRQEYRLLRNVAITCAAAQLIVPIDVQARDSHEPMSPPALINLLSTNGCLRLLTSNKYTWGIRWISRRRMKQLWIGLFNTFINGQFVQQY